MSVNAAMKLLALADPQACATWVMSRPSIPPNGARRARAPVAEMGTSEGGSRHLINHEECGLRLATSGDQKLAVRTAVERSDRIR
jgi:hypothetical protein